MCTAYAPSPPGASQLLLGGWGSEWPPDQTLAQFARLHGCWWIQLLLPLAALPSHREACAQAQRGRAAPQGPQSKREKWVSTWTGRNTFSSPMGHLPNIVGKAKMEQVGTSVRSFWEVAKARYFRVLFSNFVEWYVAFSTCGTSPSGLVEEFPKVIVGRSGKLPLIGDTFRPSLNITLPPKCVIFNEVVISPQREQRLLCCP